MKISDESRRGQKSLAFRRGLVAWALCVGVAPFIYAQESGEAQDNATRSTEPDAVVVESPAAVSPEGSEADAGLESQAPTETAAQSVADSNFADDPTAVSELTETIPVDSVNPIAQPEALASNAVDEASPTQLDEIMVTATKRSQSLRDIPSTINVLSGEKLEAQGARELQDFVDQVPGLQMQDVAALSNRKIVIRGIAPDNTTNQTVGTLLGDVPLGDPIGSYTVVDPDTWDLETVEVLKGPQGSLFGASSLAGVIRYVPNKPQLGVWQGKAFAEYVTTKDGGAAPTFGVAINAPVGNTLAFRVSGTHETRPGVIDIDNPNRQVEDADEARKHAWRAMALWEPNDRFSLNALYLTQERRADEAFFVTNFEADYTRYDAPESSPTLRAFNMLSLDARYRFDWATLVSLSALQNKENRFNLESSFALAPQAGEAGISAGRSKRDVEASGFLQEFRLVSPDGGDWTWQVGAFYSSYESSIVSDIHTPLPNALGLGPVLNLLPPGVREAVTTENGVSLGSQVLDPLDAGEVALFGEVTRRFGSVSLTVGGRLYQTEASGVSTTAGLLPFVTNRSPTTVQELTVEGKGFSPKVSLAWEATDDVLVYGGVSRGFQYGGVNTVAIPNPNSTSPPTYKSSVLWAFESGVRTDWLDRTLRADLTFFYQDWSDAQVSQVAPPAEAYIDNVGSVKVKGIEMAFRYILPIEGLSVETNGAFLDSKTASEFTDSDGNVVPTGTEMANSPRLQTATTLNYARVFGEAWTTNTALQYTHVDQAWGNIEHTGRLEARDILNLNFTLSRPDLAFTPTLGVIVNNITDQRKIVSANQNAEGDTLTDGVNWSTGYTRPRTIIVRLGASFQ